MNGRNGWDGPPPWLRDFLRRAEEALRDVAERARRASAGVEAEARRRWPPVRRRIRAAADAIEGVARRVWSRLRPVTGRLARLGRAARRHAPSRRQTAVIAVVTIGASWLLWERCGLAGCPEVDRLTSYQPGGASVLLDVRGEPFADLAPVEYEVVPLDSLPPYVGKAFVAVEDRRFFRHGGVDWKRVIGATWADVKAGGLVEGSSTIPMQLARTLFSDRIRREEKTFRRKLLEVRVAREIEDRFTKEEILELYLNHVYLGGGSYGVQAASRYYFGKRAQALTLDEAALLAALPKGPSNYDPWRRAEAARARRDLVLALMEEQDYLSFREAQDARDRELTVLSDPDRDPDGDRLAPYFVQHVRRLLEDALGAELYAERLRIHTTLDPRAQEAAEAELAAQLRAVEGGRYGRARSSGDDLQGAVVIMDALTGGVRAWVGGRDYDDSRFDRARLARRQAGSAFKPFVYAAAIEQGLSPSQPILDEPYRLARQGTPDWEPRNYSGYFEGRMSMREALVRSQNVPAVRLAASVGSEPVADLARRAGITGEVPASPVAALGVTTVSPVEMAVAYSAFAAGGVRVAPRFVERVETADGDVLWESRAERTRVLTPGVAYLVTDMLRDVVEHGTGTGVRGAGYRGPAAGKTGTTSDATDVWFVGYTPDLVGVVWVGHDEVRPLPWRATGGGVAAPVWGRIMARSYEDGTPWPSPPDEVVSVRVDPETGMALEDGCRPRWDPPRRELFLAGRVPAAICPSRRRDRLLDRFGGWVGALLGHEIRPLRVPGRTDPDLGVPRLPVRGRVADARAEEEYGDDRDYRDRDYRDYRDRDYRDYRDRDYRDRRDRDYRDRD